VEGQGVMSEHFDTVVVGGGQAGLAMGYHLSRLKRPFVILDENPRSGDSWRTRWDSLRLFTPARYDALPGSRYPAPPWSYPSREEFADYLIGYADHFALPVRNNVRVTGLSYNGQSFVIETNHQRIEAGNVVVAPGWDRKPKVPSFAEKLSPQIKQLTAESYKNPANLAPGPVLVVGAGNSGADIALELAPTRKTYLSGRHPGEIPWPIERPGHPPPHPRRLLRVFPRPEPQHSCRSEGPPANPCAQRTPGEGEEPRPGACRRRTRSQDGRRQRRPATARGRPGTRGGQRHLVHRSPP